MHCLNTAKNVIFKIKLFYFPECQDLRAICPGGKTEIVQFCYFSFIECICNDDGQSCTFEVFQ